MSSEGDLCEITILLCCGGLEIVALYQLNFTSQDCCEEIMRTEEQYASAWPCFERKRDNKKELIAVPTIIGKVQQQHNLIASYICFCPLHTLHFILKGAPEKKK